ncbi:unnamed protein product [Discula destructiva]
MADNKAQIDSIQHPKPGSWDPWDLKDNSESEYTAYSRQNDLVAFPNDPESQAADAGQLQGVEGIDPAASASITALTGGFADSGFRKMRLIAQQGDSLLIGYGMDDANQQRHELVAKVGITNGAIIGMAKERRTMERLSGAAHIKQRILTRAMPDPFDPALPGVGSGGVFFPEMSNGMPTWNQMQVRDTRLKFDRDTTVIVTQQARHGDLDTWLARMSRYNTGKPLGQRIRPPERVLWSIFWCLWHGCVAMAWPDGVATMSGIDPHKNQVPLQTEAVPPGRKKDFRPKDPLVHFNLSPSSVLIGDFDQDDDFHAHDLFPSIEISNFDHSAFPQSELRDLLEVDQEKYLWNLRERGHIASLLPEQTSEAWDYVPNLDALRGSLLAGNYGPASNTFHIGLIMWQIITCMVPEKPFSPRPYAINSLSREGTHTVLTGWTYGHALLSEYTDWRLEGGEYDYGSGVEPSTAGEVWPSELLRNTVARCMEYIPSRRPAFAKLENIIETEMERLAAGRQHSDSGEDSGDSDDSDVSMDRANEEIRQWSEWSFKEPPPPRQEIEVVVISSDSSGGSDGPDAMDTST